MTIRNRELRDVVKELSSNGFLVMRTKGGHLIVQTREGKRVYALPSTPGRGSAMKNLRADLKRKGILKR